LMMDLIEEPDRVASALCTINARWREFFLENYEWSTSFQQGVSSFSPIVYKGRWYKVMSESSVLISTPMFEKFVLPMLKEQTNFLERAIFNLDGTGQIRLLPAVLRIDSLHAVEWNPVPELAPDGYSFRKDYATEDTVNVCRIIQKSGRKVVLNKVPPEQTDFVMDNIQHDGVFLIVHCGSRQEAEDFSVYAQKWRNRSI